MFFFFYRPNPLPGEFVICSTRILVKIIFDATFGGSSVDISRVYYRNRFTTFQLDCVDYDTIGSADTGQTGKFNQNKTRLINNSSSLNIKTKRTFRKRVSTRAYLGPGEQ